MLDLYSHHKAQVLNATKVMYKLQQYICDKCLYNQKTYKEALMMKILKIWCKPKASVTLGTT